MISLVIIICVVFLTIKGPFSEIMPYTPSLVGEGVGLFIHLANISEHLCVSPNSQSTQEGKNAIVPIQCARNNTREKKAMCCGSIEEGKVNGAGGLWETSPTWKGYDGFWRMSKSLLDRKEVITDHGNSVAKGPLVQKTHSYSALSNTQDFWFQSRTFSLINSP